MLKMLKVLLLVAWKPLEALIREQMVPDLCFRAIISLTVDIEGVRLEVERPACGRL